MFSKGLWSLGLALALVLVMGSAQAATITTYAEAGDLGDVYGPPVIDSAGGPPPDDILSLASYGLGGMTVGGTGTEAALATSTASVWGQVTGLASVGGFGGEPSLYAESIATWSDTYTNNSAGDASVGFSFLINDVALGVFDYAGAPGMAAGYEIVISQDGSEIWSSSVELTGGVQGYFAEATGTPLTSLPPIPPGVGPQPVAPGANEFMISFDPYSDLLDLGTLGSGDSTTVDYSLRLWAEGPGYETGAWARAGDPFGQTPGGVFGYLYGEEDQRPPVPEPSSFALLGLGLVGAVVRVRQKFNA